MTKTPRPLRADAVRNRAIIIHAANKVFAKSGLDAPVQDILDSAKVGVGTLYRRFPTRDALIEAVLEEKMARYAAAAEDAAELAKEDPWGAFSAYAMFIFEQQATDPAFAAASVAPIRGSDAFREQHTRALRASVRLVETAKAAGVLHPDIHHSDFYLMQVANGAVAALTRNDAPDGWQRFAAYALEALRVHDTALPPVPEAWAARLNQIMSGGIRAEDGLIAESPAAR